MGSQTDNWQSDRQWTVRQKIYRQTMDRQTMGGQTDNGRSDRQWAVRYFGFFLIGFVQ